MEFSWLSEIASWLLPAALMGLVLVFIVRSGSPLLKGMSEGIKTLQDAFVSVNKQQNELIDRLEQIGKREMDIIRGELDATRKDLNIEKIARADLERRFNEASRELIVLRAELETEQKARKDVESERNQLSDKVKALQAEVAELRTRLDERNGTKKE